MDLTSRPLLSRCQRVVTSLSPSLSLFFHSTRWVENCKYGMGRPSVPWSPPGGGQLWMLSDDSFDPDWFAWEPRPCLLFHLSWPVDPASGIWPVRRGEARAASRRRLISRIRDRSMTRGLNSYQSDISLYLELDEKFKLLSTELLS